MLFIITAFFILVAWLTRYFLERDRGSKEPLPSLWAAAAFGLLALFIAGTLEVFFIPDVLSGKELGIGILLAACLGIGVIEETAKFLPLARFIFKKTYFNEYTDGIIYFAIAGLAFGLVENILYTIEGGGAVGIGRLIAVPFFHAASSGIIGYYLARAKVLGQPWTKSLGPLLALSVIHGLYNFGLFSGIVVFALVSMAITVSLTVAMFLYYKKANDIDKAQGRSAIGHNTFCRACGRANINKTLFCEYCGKQA